MESSVVDGRETVVWLGFNPVLVHPSGWARNLVRRWCLQGLNSVVHRWNFFYYVAADIKVIFVSVTSSKLSGSMDKFGICK